MHLSTEYKTLFSWDTQIIMCFLKTVIPKRALCGYRLTYCCAGISSEDKEML